MKFLWATIIMLGLTGCSSIETSKRLSVAMPDKSNPATTETNAQFLWTDKPYITPIQEAIKTLPLTGNWIKLTIDKGLCNTTPITNPAIQDNDAADVIVDAQWQQVGEDKLLSVLNTLQEQAKVPSIQSISHAATSITAGQVVAGVVVAPLYLAVGAIVAPLYVLSGEAFKDKEPQDIQKRQTFVAKTIIESDSKVTYALLKVNVQQRKEKLLFPVKTPSQITDWNPPLTYWLLVAVSAPDETQGKMALCGITAKQALPAYP